MNCTNLMVEFRIMGDNFDINEITNELSICPSEYWKKGDMIRKTNKLRETTCWIISTGYEESLDINIQLNKILIQLEKKKDILKILYEKYKLKYYFDIVINIENNEKPAIYLNKDIISFSHEINSEFDFDLYIFS